MGIDEGTTAAHTMSKRTASTEKVCVVDMFTVSSGAAREEKRTSGDCV